MCFSCVKLSDFSLFWQEKQWMYPGFCLFFCSVSHIKKITFSPKNVFSSVFSQTEKRIFELFKNWTYQNSSSQVINTGEKSFRSNLENGSLDKKNVPHFPSGPVITSYCSNLKIKHVFFCVVLFKKLHVTPTDRRSSSRRGGRRRKRRRVRGGSWRSRGPDRGRRRRGRHRLASRPPRRRRRKRRGDGERRRRRRRGGRGKRRQGKEKKKRRQGNERRKKRRRRGGGKKSRREERSSWWCWLSDPRSRPRTELCTRLWPGTQTSWV